VINLSVITQLNNKNTQIRFLIQDEIFAFSHWSQVKIEAILSMSINTKKYQSEK